MQRTDKERSQNMSREQRLKIKKDMEAPINRFLHAVDDEGKKKYPVAELLQNYWVQNPDPVLDDMRMANALLAEIRWNKSQAIKYLRDYEGKEEITMRDKHGRVMERDECYLAYISSYQNRFIALSRLREHLSVRLLSKCDGAFFTFDMYNEFVIKIKDKLDELGHELFPSEITMIEPL